MSANAITQVITRLQMIRHDHLPTMVLTDPVLKGANNRTSIIALEGGPTKKAEPNR